MSPLTDVGRNHFAVDLVGGSVTEFNNANAHLGVGDDATAFAKAQTDLIGTNFRRPMEASFPDVPSAVNIITFRSLFGTGEANFAWEEWGIFNGLAGGTMLSRKVESLGTKTAAQSFQLTVTVTVNNP